MHTHAYVRLYKSLRVQLKEFPQCEHTQIPAPKPGCSTPLAPRRSLLPITTTPSPLLHSLKVTTIVPLTAKLGWLISDFYINRCIFHIFYIDQFIHSHSCIAFCCMNTPQLFIPSTVDRHFSFCQFSIYCLSAPNSIFICFVKMELEISIFFLCLLARRHCQERVLERHLRREGSAPCVQELTWQAPGVCVVLPAPSFYNV